MSPITVVALLVACVAVANAHSVNWMKMIPAEHIDGPLKDDMYRETFEEFKSVNGKSYKTTEEEEHRFQVFVMNVKMIEEHNQWFLQGKKSFSMEVNQFTDMDIDEYIQYNKLQKRDPRSHGSTYLAASNVVLPGTVDWRNKGYVTPVKDQKQCGSCWAFSTTGSLEGQNFKRTGTLLSFSEQQLVDCSGSFGNQGCNGGLMDQAFRYIEAEGIELETSYPYTARDGNCKYDGSKVVANCTGFIDVSSDDESALQSATATIGPISIAIDASHSSFQMYSGGVYDEPNCSSTQLDHGVLIVGYGTYQGQDYWLVKNSWGAIWGLQGYIMMSRNKDNQCGVATQASYPLV